LRRLVVDPSVLLSALVGRPDAAPAILLSAIHDQVVEVVACPTLIAEVRDTLTEPYFSARLDEVEADRATATLEAVSVMVPDPIDPAALLRDPTDDYLVAIAGSTGAEAIVSADKDLLDHAGLQPPAISAGQACELLGLLGAARQESASGD
jgi:putative PIN family toxin of toxin-antitoxin system